ncbi:sensor histidine kinase [Halalkalibacter wakoensis]|nr:HAMP domain-containing sensor histidine kinase [Halalkalibacter wakoensis]
MSISFYQVSKTFYKTQLQQDIEHRLAAHREIIEEDFTSHTLHHVVVMERRGPESSFIIFDANFRVMDYSYPVDPERLIFYREWVSQVNELSQTQFVETIAHHIPHIWSAVPLKQNNVVVGYLFIDQDTGDFEQAKSKLLFISMIMALFSLLLSAIITIYLSKRWTDPLVKVRNSTREMAKGNFEVRLDAKGNDEIADLMKDTSSMAEQLKEYRDSRQQFLTNVSHDLRTPLTYMKAYAAILMEKTQLEKEAQEHATVIYQEAKRMERLVNDIFQLVKLDEGKYTIDFQEEDLVQLGKEILQKNKVEAENKTIQFTFSSSDPEIVAMVDRERFEQILLNLVTNAIRHTPENGTISLVIEQKPSIISITVHDTGEGIPNENLKHIWDRFYRVEKSRSTKHGGSGLGLAITKQLVALHNGEITVKSKVGEGTIFVIKLPNNMHI